MGFFGDVFDFENFNAKRWGQQIGQNPFRLLYGATDPINTKIWNKVLGRNDQPLIDQWGGAPKQRYEEAQKQGINTGPGGTMHGVARTIAGMYAGGAAGNAMGAGSGASSAGAGAAEGGAGTAGAINTFDSGAMAASLGSGSTGAASAATANGLYRAGERAGYDGSLANTNYEIPSQGMTTDDWMRLSQNMPTGGQQEDQRRPVAPAAPGIAQPTAGMFADYGIQPIDFRRKKRVL